MATASKAKAAEVVQGTDLDWFGAVDMHASVTRKTRPVVPVPAGLVDMLTKARAENKRPVWPVATDEELNARADVLYSAGLQLDPPASVSIRKGFIGEGGVFLPVDPEKDEKVTHIRVHVGDRRGGRAKGSAK
jgi:hypothetical protein